MPPVIGQPAPDFTLASTSGQKVTLSSYRGENVLLAFFPLAFTSTCTEELCSMTQDFTRFTSTGTLIVPISVDSVPTLKVYKEKERLSMDLLSDFKRDVSRAYGVLNAEKFYSNRSYFLIDKGGVLRWSHIEASNNERRPDDELLAAIGRM